MDSKTRVAFASIAQVRELRLEEAKATAGLFNLFAELGDKSMEKQWEAFKTATIADAVALAEQGYLAAVRKLALELMEADRTLTAEDATARVECSILEALVGT